MQIKDDLSILKNILTLGYQCFLLSDACYKMLFNSLFKPFP
jgi:hypothetical protein